MLPYPNHHRFWISQEPGQQPNPTGYAVAPAHLEQMQHYDHFFFPGHGQFNSETLEAVLRPRPAAAPQAAAHHQAAEEMAMAAAQEPRNGVAAAGGRGSGRARKRPFRTDRHSKIRTAQGVRDRRMRLSLDVARDFFALQDQLGFDKASKTVDWLLTQSKPAIERLSESSRLNAGGEEGMTTSSLTPAERSVRRLKDVMAEAAGSGKGGVDAEKVRARGGGSALTEHGCGLNGLMPAAMTGEYYYDLGEMVSNGGEGDDDGEYEEDGDFLDGMQY